MKSIIKKAIVNKKITLFLLILAIGLGIYSYVFSPRQENPEIVAPVAMITAIYPGATPKDMEKQVTSKIENEVFELEGFDYAHSQSRHSVSVTVVRLDYGTDTEKVWRRLREKMQAIQSELPRGCEDIQVDTDLVETAGLMVTLSSEKVPVQIIDDYIKDLKDKLSVVNGISRLDIQGNGQNEIKVTVDYRKLASLPISLQDIVNQIRAQNVEIPSGNLKIEKNSGDSFGDHQIHVKTQGAFKTLQDIKEIVVAISPQSGLAIRLKDIATVEKVETDILKIKSGHENGLLLTGFFRKEENIVMVGRQVDEVLKTFEEDLPEDINLKRILYQPQTVKKSVSRFVINLIQGMGFVIIVVFLGMGLRNALVVSTAIPSSIMITFGFMRIFHIPLHQISIASLIVALGMLVDNAIVISDSIQDLLDKNVPRLTACVEGTSSVAIPVLTSTLTTIAAFGPFLFLDSIAGEYISSLPQIVILSLSASYAVAIFVVPALAFLFFKKKRSKQKFKAIESVFDKCLDYGLSHKYSVLLIVFVALSITIYGATTLGLQFFPYADTDMCYIELKTDEPENLKRTESIARSVGLILDDENPIRFYTMSIGGGFPKFFNTLLKQAPSKDFAQIHMKLDLSVLKKSNLTVNRYLNQLSKKLDGNIVGAQIFVNQLEQAEPIGAPVRIRLEGKNLDSLQKEAEKVKRILEKTKGAYHVRSDFELPTYELAIVPRREQIAYSGLSSFDVQNEVSIALKGRESSEFQGYEDPWPIVVRSNISGKKNLENLMIHSSVSGKKAPLKDVGTLTLIPQIPVIKKYNGDFVIHVMADVEPEYSSEQIQKNLELKIDGNLDKFVNYQFDGEPEKIKENFGSITEMSILSAVLVYMILLFQFKKFSLPFMILLTVPLSAIGSIMGLLFTGQKLSFMAMLGVVSLLGIVVNNAIVLTDAMEKGSGNTFDEICKEAVRKRIRPILLSTITTVIGLTPLVYSQSPLFVPLATALMSGLIVATVLTLVVIPVVYNLMGQKLSK